LRPGRCWAAGRFHGLIGHFPLASNIKWCAGCSGVGAFRARDGLGCNFLRGRLWGRLALPVPCAEIRRGGTRSERARLARARWIRCPRCTGRVEDVVDLAAQAGPDVSASGREFGEAVGAGVAASGVPERPQDAVRSADWMRGRHAETYRGQAGGDDLKEWCALLALARAGWTRASAPT